VAPEQADTRTEREDLFIEASSLNVVQQQQRSGIEALQMTTPSREPLNPLDHAVDDDASDDGSNLTEIEMNSTSEVQSSGSETPIQEQEAFLHAIYSELSGSFPDLVFTASQVHDSDKLVPVLLISQRQLFSHPPFGVVSRVQVAVRYKLYNVHVLMRLWKSASFEDVAEIRELCYIMEQKSEYKFCPGVEPDHYKKEYHDVIRFHIKSVRLLEFPFNRVDSVNCSMLHKLAHNATYLEKAAGEVRCPACKRLVLDLKRQKKRTSEETPTRKSKRQRPSSRARLSHMSPDSQAKRKTLAQYERTNNVRKLQRYEESEVVLDDDQNNEMCQIMQKIGTDELETLYKEGDEHGVRKIMEDIWITDKERQREQFTHDQAANSMLSIIAQTFLLVFFYVGNGGRGNRWNMITIRMGMCMFI